MRCVEICGSDNRMDCREMFYDPINPLPRKCAKCGFPDLDHVPQPYYLVKSRTLSPNELALAENGNFFIRDRIRRVLDLVAPRQCSYFPTQFKGTSEETPWFLTVPNHQITTARVKKNIPRCESCGEPRSAHPGTQWSEILFGGPRRGQPNVEGWTSDSDYEVLKSATWGSSERGWDQWISRDLFLSVRLLHLLKKIKAKGFYEATCEKPETPDKEETAWIAEQLRAFEKNGIPLNPEGSLSDEDAKWFRDYLKTHARKVRSKWDVKAVERRVKTKLPKSYLEFVSQVGSAAFENVDEQEGFTASILTPNQLSLEEFADELEDEESRAVNGLTFATTDHGDCFCFDVQKGRKEYSIFLYKHEYNCYEPYADNFVACIRRFTGGGSR
jgi:hypothetical protein